MVFIKRYEWQNNSVVGYTAWTLIAGKESD